MPASKKPAPKTTKPKATTSPKVLPVSGTVGVTSATPAATKPEPPATKPPKFIPGQVIRQSGHTYIRHIPILRPLKKGDTISVTIDPADKVTVYLEDK